MVHLYPLLLHTLYLPIKPIKAQQLKDLLFKMRFPFVTFLKCVELFVFPLAWLILNVENGTVISGITILVYWIPD